MRYCTYKILICFIAYIWHVSDLLKAHWIIYSRSQTERGYLHMFGQMDSIVLFCVLCEIHYVKLLLVYT